MTPPLRGHRGVIDVRVVVLSALWGRPKDDVPVRRADCVLSLARQLEERMSRRDGSICGQIHPSSPCGVPVLKWM